MELALELVNHVRPEVAERLLARLRAAETARQLAEERCRRFHVQGRWGKCGRVLDVTLFLALLVLLASQAFATFSPPTPPPPPPPPSARPPSRAAAVREVAIPSALVSGRAEAEEEDRTFDENVTCEAFLFEARQETAELQRRHERLQAGFAGALQASSHWVGFLQRLVSNSSRGGPVECQEAARPGQAAIEALLAEEEARTLQPTSG